MSDAPLLSATGLSVVHAEGPRAGSAIVSSVDLSVDAGETVGLVGESGSGKSLMSRAILGLLPDGLRATGTVEFEGRDLLRLSARRMNDVRGGGLGLIMQDPFTMLNPLLTIGSQITETLRRPDGRRLKRRDRLVEATLRLAEVGIREPDAARRNPHELSGGMRQRVGIAAALAQDPRLLIADEPTTALDVTIQRDVLKLLRSLQASRRMGILIITHDLRLAFAFCDRIYVMYAGSIVEVATPAGLNSAVLHPYTDGLLRSEPPVEFRASELFSIPGSVPSATAAEGRCAFADRCAWRADVCVESKPPLTAVTDSHSSACRRVDAIRGELGRRPHESQDASEPFASVARPLLTVDSLTKRFDGGVVALDGVSVTVGAGESVGIVGESGSGKTTLGRCVLGLEQATSGTIELDGTRTTGGPRTRGERRAASRVVQMVFQDPHSSLNPALTIGATLREALGADRRAADRQVGGLLELVGLPRAFSKRRPAALSGGERQRVAIARALAVRPKLLVCDEPVSALDVSVQAQVLETLRRLAVDLDLSLIFITHDLAVARQITDRLYVLRRGQVVEAGPTADVLDRPHHEYTALLVAAIPTGEPAWLQ